MVWQLNGMYIDDPTFIHHFSYPLSCYVRISSTHQGYIYTHRIPPATGLRLREHLPAAGSYRITSRVMITLAPQGAGGSRRAIVPLKFLIEGNCAKLV